MFSALSCGEKFLDLQPQQSVSEDVFLQNIDDFNTAILGAHDQLSNSNWYGRYFLLVPDVMGEDIKQNASANRAREWAEYNGTEVDFIPDNLWTVMYAGINIVNSIINSDYTPTAAAQAAWNYKTLEEDQSKGTHNPEYSKALLKNITAFFYRQNTCLYYFFIYYFNALL